ncbi:variable surface protein [Plasmodium gonderi]|uniref:Variable surface protein n=1 Tax=Plasmodium gonderi TaxID=77519 RepID=A0A1Y1JV49_PLAGO|nr:variable surface protein [Plasmodium gonderi]GAW84622.1 variable surface protein [Plasmodium gonderi]
MSRPSSVTVAYENQYWDTHRCLDKYVDILREIESIIRDFYNKKPHNLEECKNILETAKNKENELKECYDKNLLTLYLKSSQYVNTFYKKCEQQHKDPRSPLIPSKHSSEGDLESSQNSTKVEKAKGDETLQSQLVVGTSDGLDMIQDGVYETISATNPSSHEYIHSPKQPSSSSDHSKSTGLPLHQRGTSSQLSPALVPHKDDTPVENTVRIHHNQSDIPTKYSVYDSRDAQNVYGKDVKVEDLKIKFVLPQALDIEKHNPRIRGNDDSDGKDSSDNFSTDKPNEHEGVHYGTDIFVTNIGRLSFDNTPNIEKQVSPSHICTYSTNFIFKKITLSPENYIPCRVYICVIKFTYFFNLLLN